MPISLQDCFTDPSPPTSLFGFIGAKFPHGGLSGGDIYYIRLHSYPKWLREPSFLAVKDADKLDRRISDRHGFLVIDFSAEGQVFDPMFCEAVRRLADKTKIPTSRIVFVQTNPKFEKDFLDCPNSITLCPGLRFSSYHWYVIELLRAAIRDDWPSIGHRYVEERKPRRSLLCMNAAPRGTRIALATLLARSMHRGKVFVTFGIDTRKAPPDRTYKEAVQYLARFNLGLNDIINIMEVRPFDLQLGLDREPRELAMSVDINLFNQTWASAVTETEMSNGENLRYTEKSLKPFVMGHIPIIFGNPSVLSQLEYLGFDLFRDIVPQDYDFNFLSTDRFFSAYKSVELLLQKDVSDINTAKIRNRLQKNIDLFQGSLLKTLLSQVKSELTAVFKSQHL